MLTGFDTAPEADDENVAVTVYVIEPPAGTVTMSTMLPDPDVVNPLAPPEPVAVQVSELIE